MYSFRIAHSVFALVLTCIINLVSAQIPDTIANWDGINVTWTVSAAAGQVVENPEQQGINPSAYCMEIITSSNPYDLIYTEFSVPVNFSEYPLYRLKILAPASGGNVLLKFENSNNTSWQEIEKTPAPGQWDDLEFDFSGTTAPDFIRMVIFFDFTGTNPGNQWYVDDVIRISDGPAGLTTNLPIVVINTFGVEIPDEPKITGHMSIINNGQGNLNHQYDPPNDYDGYIGIEIRGESSQMFPKKSYGFETRDEQGEKLNVPLLEMPEENDWILYAPYSDKSMLRNFISFYMGSKLDPYCSRTAYCEVIVNDDYKGVYILMEKIKKDENRVNIATLKPEDISGDELTGGYIVRVDKIAPGFIYGVDGWKSIPSPPYPNAMNITFQFYYPEAEDIVQQQRDYIQNYVSTAENALTGSNFANPDMGYNKYFNTGSFVDQMILNEVSKEVDKYRYSTYFFKEKESDGGKLFSGPAWDFNLGYSNVDYWPPGNSFTGWNYTLVEPSVWSIMFWWKRLMEDPYFKDLSKTRWHKLRQNELSNPNLELVLDSVVEYIYEAQQRNYVRWPILGTYVWPNYNWQGNDYDDEVEYLENWLFNRLTWIDNNLPGSILTPSAELAGLFPVIEIALTDEYFSREILKNSHFTLNNAPPGIAIDTVIYENASQATIILSGILNEPVDVSVTMKDKILNGFEDLTSGVLSLIVGYMQQAAPDISLTAAKNTLYLKCNRPELLGGEFEIFQLTGQRIKTSGIEQVQMNSIDVCFPAGIYICRYRFNGKIQTVKVALLK
ncbi:MAG: CotH kinase family protein [Bacteroidales bacterium]|nr:CotH kinase family protein [Bacteroidales bacterium]